MGEPLVNTFVPLTYYLNIFPPREDPEQPFARPDSMFSDSPNYLYVAATQWRWVRNELRPKRLPNVKPAPLGRLSQLTPQPNESSGMVATAVQSNGDTVGGSLYHSRARERSWPAAT